MRETESDRESECNKKRKRLTQAFKKGFGVALPVTTPWPPHHGNGMLEGSLAWKTLLIDRE